MTQLFLFVVVAFSPANGGTVQREWRAEGHTPFQTPVACERAIALLGLSKDKARCIPLQGY